MLMLSGIQHIAFCERQWALIHIEQQWIENKLTVEGRYLHEKVDDPLASDVRANKCTLRAVSLISHTLGIYGRADVIELSQTIIGDTKNTVFINGRPGQWGMVPVEYKRGKPKPDERDEGQLCAQAMCLEEMRGIQIAKGFLYYGETRHRYEVEFSEQLRTLVYTYIMRMHELFTNGITPSAVFKSHCNSCSLMDICLPKSLGECKDAERYLETIFAPTQDNQ